MPKKILYLILCLSFLRFGGGDIARAEGGFEQEKFPYTEMQIQVMPEFDYPEDWPKEEPSLLVGYYGIFINKTGTDYNGPIEFPLPVKEKNFKMYLVAEFPEENKPEVQRPYKIDQEKGTVNWQPGKPIKKDESYHFVIEYYSNPFQIEGTSKTFKFEFNPVATIDTLDLIVYSPMNAEEFSLQPEPEATTKSEYGQELHHYQYKDVKSGEALSYNVKYTKEGNESALSVISKMNPSTDNGNGEPVASGNSGSQEERPIIDAAGAAIIGGSIIIAAGLVFFGLKGQRTVNSARKPKRASIKKQNGSPSKMTAMEEKKKLRTMLLNGKIDQRTYEEKMKKLI